MFADGASTRAFVTEARVKALKDSQEICNTFNDQLFNGWSNVDANRICKNSSVKNVLFISTKSALPVTIVSIWRLLVSEQKSTARLIMQQGKHEKKYRRL
jgi:hypothetical protein